MNNRNCRVKICRSKIHGYGVVATHVIEQGEVIDINAIVNEFSEFGGFNHSCVPNVVLARFEKDVFAVATQKIEPGEELTVSYIMLVDCRPCRCPNH